MMKTISGFLAIAYSLVPAVCESLTSAPPGCITVSSGGSGQFSTIQAAVDSLSTTSTDDQCIFIDQGTYPEQVYITCRNARLTLYGYTLDSSSYHQNMVNITYCSSLATGAESDDKTATVRNWAAGTKFYNINIVNSYGIESQALALSAYNDEQGYYGCGFYGYMDTLLAEKGCHVFGRCYIQGAIDFIFGQHGQTWFDSCDIRVVSPGFITANGRGSGDDPSYFVINNSTVDAAAGSSNLHNGNVFLGRPWREYARACFQNTYLSGIINTDGWSIWSQDQPLTTHVTFGEYGNWGPGAGDSRANFSTALDSPISISTILGLSYSSWVDSSFISGCRRL